MHFALPPLYPILDAASFPADPAERARYLAATIQDLAEAGVTLVQLRAKNASRESILRDAQTLRHAAPPTLLLLLNDHADLVAATRFDGVHLGQSDQSVESARALLGPHAIIGLSTHTDAQVLEGNRTSADYLATGPVFATSSKSDAAPSVGLAGVVQARRLAQKPLVAIGGITLASAPSVWQAGANAVAVIGALKHAQRSPGTIAGDFLQLFK